MKINLHIERLVLDGVTLGPAERSLVQASLVNKLVQLFAAGGISERLADGAAISALAGTGIRLHGSTSPSNLGEQLAQSIYGGIGK